MSTVNAQKRIGIAALIWGASMILSRAIGVIRESVIGRVLGGGEDADVYLSAFQVPNFLGYLLAGGALSLVFIPMFSGYLERDDEAGGWRVFSILATGFTVALAVLIPIAGLAAPFIADFAVPGFDEVQAERWVRLTRIMLPAQLFHILGALLSAVLMSKDKHALPALANLGYAGGIIVLGILLGPSLGPEGFAWGVLIGSIIGPFGLPLIGCLRNGLQFRPVLDFKHPDLKRYLKLTFPIMLGASIVALDDTLLTAFGSLSGEGTPARLIYAKTLMKVPMGVFGMAVASAAYPTLAKQVNEGAPQKAYDTLMRSSRQVLVLAMASQAAFAVAGADVAEVLWTTERFSHWELEEIGDLTGLFCLALVAWSVTQILARGFYAMGKTWIPTVIGTSTLAVALPVYWVLGEHLRGYGLALSSTLAVCLYGVLLAAVLRKLMAGPKAAKLWPLLLRMALPTAFAIVAASQLDRFIDAQGGLPALLQGALTGALALGLTLVLARLFGVPEVSEITAKVWGKVRSKLPA